MAKLSQLLNILIIGNPAQAAMSSGTPAAAATLRSVALGPTLPLPAYPAPSAIAGPDLELINNGQFRASKVWNSVWNDYADFQLLDDDLVYGKCYIDTKSGAKVCSSRCQLGVIGIASDTFGMAVGQGHNHNKPEVPIAVGGWVLAFVDKEYPTGTPLTNDENGNLTEMIIQEKRDYPERLVAIYKKPELALEFGDDRTKVKVNGRHWVMVK